jgi:hypothetical protein
MDIVFTHGNKVLRVFCNVPESYTLDDLRRDVDVIGSPLRAYIVESAEAFLCQWEKAPEAGIEVDAPEAEDTNANVRVAARGR